MLRIRVVDGDGAVHTAGSRSTQPLVVLLTGESGEPVDRAAVSVRLPEEGATGQFPSGLRTEVLVTGPDGRVSIRGIQWGRTLGPVSLRITASKGDSRAGVMATVQLTAPSNGVTPAAVPPRRIESAPRGKWVVVAALVGAAAAGGVAAVTNGGRAPVPAAPPAVVSPPPAVTAGIGNPTVTIGRP
ncbi:MAG: hypothetical protein FJW30_01240 [Acidobacteria bacterium]|nr:hypothetical protein [Acidobacteriota bacterium]